MIIRQFTNNNVPDYNALISANNIVWRAPENSSSGTTELYFYKGNDNTITRLTNNQIDDFPKISGDNIVWGNIDVQEEHGAPTAHNLYFSNSIDTIQLSRSFWPVENEYRDNYFDISGKNVVWSANETKRYDGTEISSLDIGPFKKAVRIERDNIAWGISYSVPSVLYLYDGSEITRIFTTEDLPHEENSNYYVGNFEISGNNVAWHLTERDQNGIIIFSEIYYYDGFENKQITDNNLQEFGLKIYGNNLVWTATSDVIDYDDGEKGYTLYEGNKTAEIYFYNGSKIIQLTDNDVKDHSPQISGNNIVWQRDDGDESEIFAFNGSRVIQLTNNNVPDEKPQIDGDNIVWHRTVNGSDDFASAEIFTTNLTYTHTKENESYLYRFRNTLFGSGTYLFVNGEEANAILANPHYDPIFELEGNNNSPFSDTPAFKVSTQSGEGLIPFYRLRIKDIFSNYLFVTEGEYNNIFADDSPFKNSWVKEGLDENGNDLADFYLYGAGSNEGTVFNRFRNQENGTYLFTSPAETNNILNDPNLSSVFINEGQAFEALV